MLQTSLPLFEPPQRPLAAPLRHWADKGIFLGASSWKYEAWLGQIYTSERYLTRGQFSRKRFEAECLAEYAETFPAVCGDFSFYQFPVAAFWDRLFKSVPPSFQFAFKVPEFITVDRWPRHLRYGKNAGEVNEMFLDAGLLQTEFLRLLEPFEQQVAVLIFEFGASASVTLQTFLSCLDPFLKKLPPRFRYAVEIRNPEYLEPSYLEILRTYNIAHVLNSWTRMPAITQQSATPGVFTADFIVARALLKPGRTYEEAIARFQPYQTVREPLPEVRSALRALMQRADEEGRSAFIFLNNRLEGNSPGTIEALVSDAAE